MSPFNLIGTMRKPFPLHSAFFFLLIKYEFKTYKEKHKQRQISF